MVSLLQNIHFDNTIGALLIGFSVSAVFYGMFSMQVYSYYRRYPMDKAAYKAIVASLWLAETTHQVLLGHCLYYYTVTNYMNIAALLGKPVWSLPTQLLVGALVGTIVKFLFSMRVWRFSYGNWWLTGILLILTFGQLALAITFAVKSFEAAVMTDLANLRLIGSISLGLGVVNDICVAASLCFYLQSMRMSYEKTDSIIKSLTIYAINTGVLTSVMSFTTLIIFDLLPKNLIFVGCYFILSKLYAISFIATLNTRQNIRGRGTDGEQVHTSFQIVTDHRTLSIPLQVGVPSVALSEMGQHNDQEAGQVSSQGLVKPTYAIGW